MWILDFTDKLSTDNINYYVFNPSILHWKDDLFLIAYRIAFYDIPVQYHPWKIWDNGYKFFKNSKQIMIHKYRNVMGPSLYHKLISQPIIQKYSEHDSTGLAIARLKNNEELQIINNIADLFPNEMNQDARLCNNGGLLIIYNTFEFSGVKLRYRDIIINDHEIFLSEEKYLFDHIYRPVEKHCYYSDDRQLVYYGIGDNFEIINLNNNNITKISSKSHFEYLYNKYGKSNVFLSLSTSHISFDNLKIAIGHAKITFKEIPNFDFLENIDTKNVYLHGKFIYFMFIYEFDDQHNITRVSPLFIPSIDNNHLPYLLVMPISIIFYNDKYFISYGEGDTKCKCLILNHDEINMLLNSKFYPSFLTEKINLNHVGYWCNFNCGDDAYIHVFNYLYKGTPNNIKFSLKYDPHSDLNILGGGDVINDYFTKDISENTIAISVGIPYMEFVPLLDKFKCVYLRNENDSKLFTKTKYIPDLTFILPKLFGRNTNRIEEKTVGIILARTYYNIKYLEEYETFCDEIANFVFLLHKNKFKITFIPFCINENNSNENDYYIINDIVKRINFHVEIFHPGINYVRDIYEKISHMSFNICSRFHAHIFSTINAVPFISLTCGRKCIEYMKQIPDCLYKLKKNEIDIPIEFDGKQFYNFFISKYVDRKKIGEKLNLIYEKNNLKLLEFISSYQKMLRKYSNKPQSILWIPTNENINITCSIPYISSSIKS
uniref:Polysaccharide pyruvyl transferase domain-containing protein n=1 Tax=viral metagenome TaxID=1070528 RepID=A0A6C0LT18_9ZZZZ